MDKTSTLFYSVNNLGSRTTFTFEKADSFHQLEQEFSDIINELHFEERDVSQQVVDAILGKTPRSKELNKA